MNIDNKHQPVSTSRVRKTPDEDLRHCLQNEDKNGALFLLNCFHQNQFKKISEDNVYLDTACDNANEQDKRAINFITSNSRIHYGKSIRFEIIRDGSTRMLNFTIIDIGTNTVLHNKLFSDTPNQKYPDYFKLNRLYFLYDGYKIMTVFTNRAGQNTWMFEKIN